ncbi:MAG TPA: peptide-methionine (S)-S-oxide reductase MsrA [Bryobacteraceae bacterium]|nr:peptide-methionine (S)-S-oxide reductase MsrA [Bryobacteraceae bacterium]
MDFPDPADDLQETGTHTAVLAGGCFWCTEAVFQQIEGVDKVVSGYSGGEASTANYEAVCTGRTGHAESIEITYDAGTVSYGRLLKIFFSVAHDPTQLNRQGADRGTQYRSAIFYVNEDQKRVAEAYLQQLDQAHAFSSPIVTEVSPLKAFYPAEQHHQNFCNLHPDYPYVVAVADPKVAKTQKQYPELLKK